MNKDTSKGGIGFVGLLQIVCWRKLQRKCSNWRLRRNKNLIGMA